MIMYAHVIHPTNREFKFERTMSSQAKYAKAASIARINRRFAQIEEELQSI